LTFTPTGNSRLLFEYEELKESKNREEQPEKKLRGAQIRE
jgi:hypothetical protein